jgi:hypothetical protein
VADEFTWEKFGDYEKAERGSCVLFVHTKGPPFHWVLEDGLAILPPGTEEARRSPRIENYYVVLKGKSPTFGEAISRVKHAWRIHAHQKAHRRGP